MYRHIHIMIFVSVRIILGKLRYSGHFGAMNYVYSHWSWINGVSADNKQIKITENSFCHDDVRVILIDI